VRNAKAWGIAPGKDILNQPKALKARNNSESMRTKRCLNPYLATIFRSLKSPSLTIDGTTDHVHILFSLSRVIKIADLVEEVKTDSSKWIKTKGLEFENFHWQRGYGAFSIGQSQVPILKRYIARQKVHHQRVTFQDEYRKFLKTYGIDYDERYVWD
jgi:REP element-mobilizing transposase RayT